MIVSEERPSSSVSAEISLPRFVMENGEAFDFKRL